MTPNILGLGNKHLTIVPSHVLELKDLVALNLDYNLLTVIPEELGKLTLLTRLGIRHNRLTSVPKRNRTVCLRHINLSFNKLTSVPKEICQLRSLTYLDLSDNQLTSLSVEIGQLRYLTYLDLSNNPMIYPPASIIDTGTKSIVKYCKDNPDTTSHKDRDYEYVESKPTVGFWNIINSYLAYVRY